MAADQSESRDCDWCRQDGCKPGVNDAECPCPHHAHRGERVTPDSLRGRLIRALAAVNFPFDRDASYTMCSDSIDAAADAVLGVIRFEQIGWLDDRHGLMHMEVVVNPDHVVPIYRLADIGSTAKIAAGSTLVGRPNRNGRVREQAETSLRSDEPTVDPAATGHIGSTAGGDDDR